MLMGKVKVKECEAGQKEDRQRDLKGEKGGQEDRERRIGEDRTHLGGLLPWPEPRTTWLVEPQLKNEFLLAESTVATQTATGMEHATRRGERIDDDEGRIVVVASGGVAGDGRMRRQRRHEGKARRQQKQNRMTKG